MQSSIVGATQILGVFRSSSDIIVAGIAGIMNGLALAYLTAWFRSLNFSSRFVMT